MMKTKTDYKKYNDTLADAARAETNKDYGVAKLIYSRVGTPLVSLEAAARCTEKMGDTDAAKELYSNASEAFEENNALDSAARLAEKAGDYGAAFELYVQAADENISLSEKAKLSEKAGLFKQASRYYEEDKDFYSAAQTSEQAGEPERAKQMYSLVVTAAINLADLCRDEKLRNSYLRHALCTAIRNDFKEKEIEIMKRMECPTFMIMNVAKENGMTEEYSRLCESQLGELLHDRQYEQAISFAEEHMPDRVGQVKEKAAIDLKLIIKRAQSQLERITDC